MSKKANRSSTGQEVAPPNFWQKLKKPLFVLAPMANVTDAAFRKMIAKYGKPDVMWTEFVSADGLASAGRERLLIDLKFSKEEKPIVAQLFGSRPEAMMEASKLVAKLGFDGIDINMGCPDRAVERGGAGAAMIKSPEIALQILEAARSGWKKVHCPLSEVDSLDTPSAPAGAATRSPSPSLGPKGLSHQLLKGGILPISIKTRIGYNSVDWSWIELLLRQNLPALTIHLRTRKEMSDVPAHWELMPKIVAMRDDIQKDIPKKERTLIIGNGDVEDMIHGRELIKQYGCDGVMIGRGIFGRPWTFSEKSTKKLETREMRLKIMLEHATLFEKYFGGKDRKKNFAVMKKHFKAYVSGWEGAKELRVKLMDAEDLKGVKGIVEKL